MVSPKHESHVRMYSTRYPLIYYIVRHVRRMPRPAFAGNRNVFKPLQCPWVLSIIQSSWGHGISQSRYFGPDSTVSTHGYSIPKSTYRRLLKGGGGCPIRDHITLMAVRCRTLDLLNLNVLSTDFSAFQGLRNGNTAPEVVEATRLWDRPAPTNWSIQQPLRKLSLAPQIGKLAFGTEYV